MLNACTRLEADVACKTERLRKTGAVEEIPGRERGALRFLSL
jgi:hypothetical protein